MSRNCLEKLKNKKVLEQFDSKINEGKTEQVASLEILQEQVNIFKNEYLPFITKFKNSNEENDKFKIIEDSFNSQLEELLKVKTDLFDENDENDPFNCKLK